MDRLCGWAVCDGFGKNVLVNQTGDTVDPFDIYVSWRFIRQEADPFRHGTVTMPWGTQQTLSPQVRHILDTTLILADHVMAFCEKTNTLPPSPLQGGLTRFIGRYWHKRSLAPPECVDAETVATHLSAVKDAESSLNALEWKLRERRGERQFGKRRNNAEVCEVDLTWWVPKWEDACRLSEHVTKQSQVEAQRERFEQLKSEGREFIEAESARQQALTENVASEDPKEDKPAQKTLVVEKQKKTVIVFGESRPITDRPFRVLVLLATHLIAGKSLVSQQAMEGALWGRSIHKVKRTIPDVIRDLRQQMKENHPRADEVSALIRTRQSQGYELTVSPNDVELIEA